MPPPGTLLPLLFSAIHDTGRIAGVVGRKEERVKFAYGLAGMLSGNLFTYYGDEIVWSVRQQIPISG